MAKSSNVSPLHINRFMFKVAERGLKVLIKTFKQNHSWENM